MVKLYNSTFMKANRILANNVFNTYPGEQLLSQKQSEINTEPEDYSLFQDPDKIQSFLPAFWRVSNNETPIRTSYCELKLLVIQNRCNYQGKKINECVKYYIGRTRSQRVNSPVLLKL